MTQWVKNIFLLSHPKLVFFTRFYLDMGHPVVLKHIWFERKGHQICGWCTQQWRQHQTLLTCLRRQESSCNYWFWHSPQSESIHWRSWCGTMTKAVFSNRIIKGAFSGAKDCKGNLSFSQLCCNLILSTLLSLYITYVWYGMVSPVPVTYWIWRIWDLFQKRLQQQQHHHKTRPVFRIMCVTTVKPQHGYS